MYVSSQHGILHMRKMEDTQFMSFLYTSPLFSTAPGGGEEVRGDAGGRVFLFMYFPEKKCEEKISDFSHVAPHQSHPEARAVGHN